MFPEGTDIRSVDAPGARMRAAIHGEGPEVVRIPGGGAAADRRVEQWARLPGLGHVSLARHAPDRVAGVLRPILEGAR